ncbi:hypothetical protein [Mycobacterium sp. 1423905.2]|uniref:hypothetical protein n=1 Tax=Mycobacterium sp. 1423905.2 TaxID=1856859 RepID=UPI0007FED3EA|nr:hypothetical protein [Mycobacterium sp. 1423905.2]OBJ50925.1 hypothetical protein A9W95_23125 [Mycobacterium sp. 1423905.2]
MLIIADIGRGAEVAVTRGADVVHQVLDTTVLHVRRIVGALTQTLTRVAREAHDLAWDYQDVAGELRTLDGRTRPKPVAGNGDSIAEVLVLPVGDKRRRSS